MMVGNVFVYGTLMADEVVSVLLRRLPPSSPAVLYHYKRYSVHGRSYPAIVPVEDAASAVAGKLNAKCSNPNRQVLMGITDSELAIFDTYEAEEYERKEILVATTNDSSEQLTAYTYVWADKSDPDLYGNWDFEEWKQQHITECIEMTKEFMEELEQLIDSET